MGRFVERWVDPDGYVRVDEVEALAGVAFSTERTPVPVVLVTLRGRPAANVEAQQQEGRIVMARDVAARLRDLLNACLAAPPDPGNN